MEMSNQLDRIEAKLDHIIMNMQKSAGGRPTTTTQKASSTDEKLPFSEMMNGWTTKQHVVLQMILRSASNEEIAERLGVTINSAKVHVRTIAKKLMVTTRSEIVIKSRAAVEEVDDDLYIKMTKGVPKDWDNNYSIPDPYHAVIHGVEDERKA